MKACVVMGFSVLWVQIALAQDESAVPNSGDVAELIVKLDSEVFRERESAAQQLRQIGKPAIAALTVAAEGESVETRFRSLGILKSLYGSEDPATKEAAKNALEELTKSANESTRRSAENILAAPQYELPPGIWRGEGSAHVFGGERPILLGGEGGISITGEGSRIGAGGQLILARADGGRRRIDLIKGTGVGVLLLEDDDGIEIHLRQPQGGGDPEFTRYLAKDAPQLEEKHPKIHKIYKAFAGYQRNQTIIGGVKIDF